MRRALTYNLYRQFEHTGGAAYEEAVFPGAGHLTAPCWCSSPATRRVDAIHDVAWSICEGRRGCCPRTRTGAGLLASWTRRASGRRRWARTPCSPAAGLDRLFAAETGAALAETGTGG